MTFKGKNVFGVLSCQPGFKAKLYYIFDLEYFKD